MNGTKNSFQMMPYCLIWVSGGLEVGMGMLLQVLQYVSYEIRVIQVV